MPNSTSNQLYKIQKTKTLYISSDLLRLFSKHSKIGTSLVVQWLRLYASNAGGASSIPGWGTKIPHATGHKRSKITVPPSSQNCFENHMIVWKNRSAKWWEFESRQWQHRASYWWYYLIILLTVLSTEWLWKKRAKLGFHKTYKKASQFVPHFWRLQPVILDLIERHISKEVNFGLKYLRVVGVEKWSGNLLCA